MRERTEHCQGLDVLSLRQRDYETDRKESRMLFEIRERQSVISSNGVFVFWNAEFKTRREAVFDGVEHFE